MRVLIRSPLDTLHILIVESLDPDAKYSPFGENDKVKTEEECPLRVLMISPLVILHILIVQSKDPEAK